MSAPSLARGEPPAESHPASVQSTLPTLKDLGWKPFFSAQLSPDESAQLRPGRVMAVHRGKIAVASDGAEWLIPPHMSDADREGYYPAVGDWLLVHPETLQIARILRRASLFKRLAPGNARRIQLIAANVDKVFIVASCNQDFSVARLERYLVLAQEAGVTPIIVLTKADLADSSDAFAEAAGALQAGLLVMTVNAKDPVAVAPLTGWCGEGETVALLGSSGVGKSTLINTLTGTKRIATQAVREADGKGRHTTTVREMHRLDDGGWLLDTPGMRELQLTDAAEGVAEVFDDIAILAHSCRFANCTHALEPGCAVKAELEEGKLDINRLHRWSRLKAEDAANTADQVQQRDRTRAKASAKRKLRFSGVRDTDAFD